MRLTSPDFDLTQKLIKQQDCSGFDSTERRLKTGTPLCNLGMTIISMTDISEAIGLLDEFGLHDQSPVTEWM